MLMIPHRFCGSCLHDYSFDEPACPHCQPVLDCQEQADNEFSELEDVALMFIEAFKSLEKLLLTQPEGWCPAMLQCVRDELTRAKGIWPKLFKEN